MNIIVNKIDKRMACFVYLYLQRDEIDSRQIFCCHSIKTTLSKLALLIVFEFSDIRVVSPSYSSSLLNDNFLFYFIFCWLCFDVLRVFAFKFASVFLYLLSFPSYLYFSWYLFYLYFVILFILSSDIFPRGKTW